MLIFRKSVAKTLNFDVYVRLVCFRIFVFVYFYCFLCVSYFITIIFCCQHSFFTTSLSFVFKI